MIRTAAIGAGLSGAGASVAASLPSESWLDAASRLPTACVLGLVCCWCVWVMYRQGRDYATHTQAENRSNRECLEQIAARLDKVCTSLTQISERVRER